MPADVRRAIRARGLMQAFASRPPYQRNDYLGWIDQARKPATRKRRLDQMLKELERGDRYMKMAWTGSGAKVAARRSKKPPSR